MHEFIIVLAMLLGTTFSQAATAILSPRGCATLSDGKSYVLTDSIRLADAIVERPSSMAGPGVFHQDAIFMRLDKGQRVLLSGSANGGGFRTDDLLQLETIPADKVRTWDFRSRDHMIIVPVDTPADITEQFVTGHNMVQITMRDVLKPVLSSSPYWLLIFDPCDPPAPVPASPITSTTASSLTTPIREDAPLTSTVTSTATSSVTMPIQMDASPTITVTMKPAPAAAIHRTPEATIVKAAPVTVTVNMNELSTVAVTQWLDTARRWVTPGTALTLLGLALLIVGLWRLLARSMSKYARRKS